MIVLLIILSLLGFLFVGGLIRLGIAASVAYDLEVIEWQLRVAIQCGSNPQVQRARRLGEKLHQLRNLPFWKVSRAMKKLRRKADQLFDEVLWRA